VTVLSALRGSLSSKAKQWLERTCLATFQISRSRLGDLARMIGQEDAMFTMPFRKREREQGAFLNATQQTLIKEKFEILQQASFGFTQDRLLHISQEESKSWTKECTDELRSEIALAAPSHVQIVLIDFPKLRCVSLQCLPLGLLPAPVYS
jgi:hypothetical protein